MDADPKLRTAYALWSQETCRYGDTDRQGHVNNAVFSTFLETGRVNILMNPRDRLAPEGGAFVIVRLTLEYRREMRWGDTIDIGTSVLRLGNASFTFGQGLFRGDDCVATAETVLVLMDEATRRAMPLPVELRARLTVLMSK